ncbi:MAG TPA: threonine ammonia-lyase [Solirubrobacteraceae bacterium]|jgi:threonine dehydratase|nr:threonine ammonia-lyase [Solirubrobacteraceae bacterium]
MSVTADDVAAARERTADVVRPTPVLPSATLSERLGAEVALKAENLQRTGSFKVRGAANKVSRLGEACAAGVVTGSAGNHAQALAHAAQARGVPCEVFMPAGAPLSKVEGAEALGARVILGGETVHDCLAAAAERADAAGMTVVHPYDDPDVIAGQGTLGLELLEAVPDLAKVVVPVGGGGLVSGLAIAVKSARPEVEVVGVQVESCAAFADSLRGAEVVEAPRPLTIADGIAVKRPGRVTLALAREWLDGVVTVAEDEIAEAMVLLLEKAKQVVEGAGAVGVAALMFEHTPPAASGTTVAILSGGNVDAGLLAEVARRHETGVGRRLLLQSRIGDRPGSLARLLSVVGDQAANLIEVQHVREGLDLHVRETAVQLVLETRGREHAEAVLEAIRAAGYEARVLR